MLHRVLHSMHLRVALLWLRTGVEFDSALLVVAASPVHATIPPILDCVVAASSQTSGNLSPSLAHLGNHLLDHDTFLRSDGVMVEVGLEVLVISLSALLWGSSLNGRRYPDPVVGSMDSD